MTALASVVRRAAVTGAFDPDALMAGVPEDERAALIGELALLCDESDPAAGDGLWLLRGEPRRLALHALTTSAEVRAALAGAPPGDDAFTVTLRAALAGRSARRWDRAAVPLPEGSNKSLPAMARRQGHDAAVHSALQFAAHAPVVDGGAMKAFQARTEARIAARRQHVALTTSLPDTLVGRRSAFARLRRFATDPALADRRPMLVTGLGGVGKSALIAALLLSLTRARGHAILIDFDRFDLATGGPLPLLREIVRQLEPMWRNLGQTAAADRMAALKTQIQRLATDKGLLNMPVAEQRSVCASTVFPELQALPAALREQPLLFVFDSFEAIDRTAARAVLDLEATLPAATGLLGLRTVVSGREVPLDEDTADVDGSVVAGALDMFGPVGRRVPLVGLDDTEGAAFLALRDRHGRFPEVAARRRASAAVRGHPLAIIVLERFARDRSDAEVAALLAELEENPDFSAEFAQAFLYTRVLARIDDPDIARLAHPGLVLRQVTPDLIRLVLAGPCELGAVSPERAAALFATLARQYWLVEPDGKGVLRHRPEPRRLMLPGMFSGPRDRDDPATAGTKRRLAAHSRDVARRAAALWEEGPPADDPAAGFFAARTESERWVEATYYRALAGASPPERMSVADAAALTHGLREDVDTLPAAWRAEIKAARGDFARLSAAEVATLSASARERYEAAAIERNLRGGSAGAARRQAGEEARRRREQDTLAEAQELLRTAGLYDGRIDGVAGPKMGRALDGMAARFGVRASVGEGAASLLDTVRQVVAEHGAAAPAAPAPAAPAPPPRSDAPMSPELADMHVRARFQEVQACDAADRAVALDLLTAFGRGEMATTCLREIEGARLWNTGVWQGTLMLRLADERSPSGPPRIDASDDHPPPLAAAEVLLARLIGGAPERVAFAPSRVVARQDWRVQGTDGLRLAAATLLEFAERGEAGGDLVLDALPLCLIGPAGPATPRPVLRSRGDLSTDAVTSGALDYGDQASMALIDALSQRSIGLAELGQLWTTRPQVVLRSGIALDHLPAVLLALRGQTPELVEPAAAMLAALDAGVAGSLVNVVAAQAVLWPRDLWFGPAGSYPGPREARPFTAELAFAAVQTADRAGLLRVLLTALREHRPAARQLLAVHDLITAAFFTAAAAVEDGHVPGGAGVLQ